MPNEIDLGDDFSFLPIGRGELSDEIDHSDETLVFTTKKKLAKRLPERVVSEIHQAIGQASVCWEHLDSAGVFDTERAIAIGSDLCNFIADFLENK